MFLTTISKLSKTRLAFNKNSIQKTQIFPLKCKKHFATVTPNKPNNQIYISHREYQRLEEEYSFKKVINEKNDFEKLPDSIPYHHGIFTKSGSLAKCLIEYSTRFGEKTSNELEKNILDLRSWLSYLPSQKEFDKLFVGRLTLYQEVVQREYQKNPKILEVYPKLKKEIADIQTQKTKNTNKTFRFREEIFEKLKVDKKLYTEEFEQTFVLKDSKKKLPQHFVCTPLLHTFVHEDLFYNNCLKLLPNFIENYLKIMALIKEKVETDIISARELTPQQKKIVEKMANDLIRKHNKKSEIVYYHSVDKSNIEGFEIRARGLVELDLTLKTKLSEVKRETGIF